MLYTASSQLILITATALLASGSPVSMKDLLVRNAGWSAESDDPTKPSFDTELTRRGSESVPSCASSVNDLRWPNPSPPWVKDGKVKGKPFCLSHWDTGATIVGLESWKQSNRGDCGGHGAITRLEVRFSDGAIVPIGGDHKECWAGSIGLNENESWCGTMRSDRSSDNPHGHGSLHIEACKKVGDLGYAKTQNTYLNLQRDYMEPFYDQDTHIRPMIGITGYVDGDVITALNFQFAPGDFDRLERRDMVYDHDYLARQQITPSTVALGSWTNTNGAHTDTFKIESTHTETRTSTSVWRNTFTRTGGMTISAEVDLKLPLWKWLPSSKVGVEGKWELSYEYQRGNDDTKTTTETITYTYTGNIDKGQTATCTATTGRTKLDRAPFKAKSTMFFKGDAKPWTFTEEGWLNADLPMLSNNVVCSYRTQTALDLKTPGMHII